jgi:hypothetical protein
VPRSNNDLKRPPLAIPPDQDQRDREEVRAHDLHSRLVVLEGEKLYLLPVQGSETQWYKNVLQNPSIRIDARGVEAGFRADPVTDAKAVKSVIEKFREQYGVRDVKKYYSKFDVAVVVESSEQQA